MSTCIVDPINIDAIVHFVDRTREPLYVCDGLRINPENPHDLQRAGQILTAENYRSIDTRYRVTTAIPVYRYRRTHVFRPLVILRLLAYYEHESREAPNYEQSTARKLIDAIRKVAVVSLPGYKEIPWRLNESHRVIRNDTPAVLLIEKINAP